ncbi:hypothetical protein AB395_00005092 (plasmid) [Sinorhizobium fredii CCBAU 45436]|nr:hypothetical protein AB395_00005092 [Sinorhizobium fredii CCBAU 45436]
MMPWVSCQRLGLPLARAAAFRPLTTLPETCRASASCDMH